MSVIFEDKDKIYTINEVAKMAKLHPQTLRNWEKTELLNPQRIAGNQRVYTRKDLEIIEEICTLKNEGWNLQAIRSYLGKKKNEESN